MTNHRINTLAMIYTILFHSLFLLCLFMMILMRMTTVTGHPRKEAKLEASYNPFNRPEDIHYYGSFQAKEVTSYYSFDGVNHDDHDRHPYSHPNHKNSMARFRNDMNEIPIRLVKKNSVVMTNDDNDNDTFLIRTYECSS
jgi:hypothetical protein